MSPEETAAQTFMAHKGYPDAEPYEIDKIDGQKVWYFMYKLNDGTLELEVAWANGEWSTVVTTFSLAN